MIAPSISIAILNYQRKDVLRRSIERALAQRCPGLEVLVVDNASTDGSAEMVQQEFPTVRLLQLPRNTGCAARNTGVAAVRADIVITLDNDVLLNSPDDAAKVVDFFARHPTVACVNFKILDTTGALSRRDWCHPRDWRTFSDRQFLTNYVLEGASAHQRNRFLDAGGYWAPLFLGHEGLDLGLRLVAAGHDLAYWPDVAVTHLASPEARPSSRIYYTFTRNGILVALRNHRPLQALLEIAKTVALMAFAAARARHWVSFISGIAAAVRDIPIALATRRPLRRDAYARLGAIRHLEPGVLAKAWRHWCERSL